MTEGDSSMNMNNSILDPAAAMYHHAGNLGSMDRTLSASQADQTFPDTLMTEMLQDNFDYDGMPDMNLDMNALGDNGNDGNIPKSFTPLSNLMSPTGNEQTNDGGRVGINTGDAQIGETGAGPLPAGFGAQSSLPSSSTVTDFTKRRNWPQKVIEEIKDFMHVLTPNGKVVYASPSCQSLTGYTAEELSGKFIVDFIHPDDSATYVREFNESIASGNPLRFYYRFRKKDKTFTIFESHGHAHYASAASSTSHVPPKDTADYCRGFFMMARPYPTKNAVLLDSFLEHKIEFERMSKRIKDLKREEEEEYEDSERHWAHKQPSESSDTITTSMSASMAPVPSHPDFLVMPPPARPDMSHSTLTKANLEDASSGSKPDSINDKMRRYEGVDRIQMLTGLQYREGERSQGISTGDHSPALIRGDAGIAIPVDKDGRLGDKKKKIKLLDEYVCTDCGTLDSPEWRKGPSGPKTLCNACGLRWAKKEKKQKPEPSNPPAGP
ncbi:white collar 2 type of transcription factor [Ciborinia camelliae]|nr:white collar 2 type of transcription factor [Ciborinia camelliae]